MAEVDATGAPRALYIHGPGIDEPLAIGRPTGTFLYHADGLGSITTLTNTSGAPVRSYTYDSFGRIVAQTGTLANPYTYTGRELDPETGLMHYRRRYYDPLPGRFVSQDPLGLRAGLNLYRYVGNNPLRYLDPNGLASVDSSCPDCPSGQWEMDIKHGISFGLIFGVSRTVVDFTCKGGQQRCRGYVDCGSVGLQAVISWSFASVEFEQIGTGSTVSGFFNAEQLRSGFSSFGPIINAPLAAIFGFNTQGNNLAFDLGFGLGIAYQGCFARYLFCER